MFKLSNKESEEAKTIKWDYIDGNIVKFYDTSIPGITNNVFKQFDQALSMRQIDAVKPIALLVNQNASISRTKTRSPYFGVIQGATEEGRTYWIDMQYLTSRIMTKGVMTKHAHFTTDYPQLTNFYIANNSKDFIFGLDIDMDYKYTDVFGGKELIDMFYVVGVRQSYIRQINKNEGLATFATVKELLSELKRGILQKKNYHYEGANLVENKDQSYVPKLIKDLETMIAIPLPECNYLPKFDIYFNDNDVYLYASSSVNAALFMYEFILNSDTQDDMTDYIYKVEDGMNEFGNNIFNENVWVPTEEDKRIDIIEDNKELLDELKRLKEENKSNNVVVEELKQGTEEDFNNSDEAIKQMMELGSIDEQQDDMFDDIINSIGGED